LRPVVQVTVPVWPVPNQRTYLNVLAGSDPAYVSSDSDFDWGQDVLAVERYFKGHPVPELYVQLNGARTLTPDNRAAATLCRTKNGADLGGFATPDSSRAA